jgi:hypothetical protein
MKFLQATEQPSAVLSHATSASTPINFPESADSRIHTYSTPSRTYNAILVAIIDPDDMDQTTMVYVALFKETHQCIAEIISKHKVLKNVLSS